MGNNHSTAIEAMRGIMPDFTITEEQLQLMKIRKMALSQTIEHLSYGDIDKAVGAIRIYDWARSM